MIVLDKQLGRVGLVRYDVGCGAGDGAPENTGSSGTHATFEQDVPGYAQRRCLLHIGCRNGDAALAETNQKLVRASRAYMGTASHGKIS